MKNLVIAVAALALAACGSTTTDAFTIASGNYLPSSATANADQCQMLAAFNSNPDTFPVSVATDGKSAFLNFTTSRPTGSDILVAIDGNAITTRTQASYQTVETDSTGLCTFLTTTTVKSGELLAKDDMHLVVEYKFTNVSGCTAAGMAIDALPCTSQIDMQAKKTN